MRVYNKADVDQGLEKSSTRNNAVLILGQITPI